MAKRKYKEDKDFQEFVQKFDKRLYRTLGNSDSLNSVLYIAFIEGYKCGGNYCVECLDKALKNLRGVGGYGE